MLIKGASRSIEDENGLKPIDVVEELKADDLKKELRGLLEKQPSYIPCCHFKQPMKKIDPSNSTLTGFILMVGGTFVLMLLFVFPYIFADGWFPILAVLFTAAFVFFTITVNM